MKNYLFDFVLAFTIKKEKDILKFNNEILKNLVGYNFCILFFFDNSRDMCTYNNFSKFYKDKKNIFIIYDPSTKNLADAYFKTYKKAVTLDAKWVISMNGGFRHDPADLKLFLRSIHRNIDCMWGYRTRLKNKSPFIRKFISKSGDILSRLLLNISYPDLTSGFYAIRKNILKYHLNEIISFTSKFHFFDTELKYILKDKKSIFIPINYTTYNRTMKINIILDSIKVLLLLFYRNLKSKYAY